MAFRASRTSIPTAFCAFTVLGALSLLSLVACGRRASASECQLILDRSVELQMKEMRDAEANAIASRQEVLRQELAADLKEKCNGRHMTDEMMACVKKAQSTEELDGCIQ
jgi:hypothetical protein